MAKRDHCHCCSCSTGAVSQQTAGRATKRHTVLTTVMKLLVTRPDLVMRYLSIIISMFE
jgi:hypothetical protein